MWGGIGPGKVLFPPGLLMLYMYGRISDSEMWHYHLRVRRDIDHEQFRQRGWVSPYRGAVSTRAMSVLVLELLELWTYRRNYNTGAGPYRPRVWRYLAVVATGNSRRALDP